jgi:hypothetical protein
VTALAGLGLGALMVGALALVAALVNGGKS